MKRNTVLPLVLLALGLCLTILTGCRTSGIQAGMAVGDTDPYIIVDDPALASQVSIASLKYDKIGPLLRANALLISNRHRTLMLQAKFCWFDKNGFEIDPDKNPYHTIRLEGRDGKQFQSVAPNKDAREFKIRIKKIHALKIDNVR